VSDEKQEACKTYIEQTKLLVTLASAFLLAPAAIIGLVRPSAGPAISIIEWRLAITTEGLLIASVLCGYVVLATLVGSQYDGTFNVYRTATRVSSLLQIGMLLAAMVLLALLTGSMVRQTTASAPAVVSEPELPTNASVSSSNIDGVVSLLRDNWQFIAGIVVAIWTVSWTVSSYMMNRRNEAAWKRTEFVFTQLRFLDTDPGISNAIAILEGWNPGVTPEDVFTPTPKLAPEMRGKHVAEFDRLLNLLWCISYAFLELKTITWKELGGFGWYLWRVQTTPSVANYCRNNGYADILHATQILSVEEKWDEDGGTLSDSGPRPPRSWRTSNDS
jgi:hypothetical protein